MSFRRYGFLFLFPAFALPALQAHAWKQSPGSSNGAATHPSQTTRRMGRPDSAIDAGAIRDGVYRNRFFGFSCKIPFGWVERTKEMRDDSADTAKSSVLLAIFERPPEATGNTINSAVVVAFEKASSFSGLKTAADYFGPVTELATARGFKAVNGPYDFPVGAKPLVRGDFSKERGSLNMRQTSLVMLENGYAVSFTFIGGSEDEVEELIGRLSFTAKKPM